MVAFYWLYEWIRGLVVQSGSLAVDNANWLIDLEQRLGLLWERDLQSIFIDIHPLIRSFNLYYGGTHFLVPIATLLWVAMRHPADYPRVRTLLAVTTAIGFAIFSVLPMAPPRLMPARLGIVDTIRHLDGVRVASELDGPGRQRLRRDAEPAHGVGGVDAPRDVPAAAVAAGRRCSWSPTRSSPAWSWWSPATTTSSTASPAWR